jgi:hypothetical protein
MIEESAPAWIDGFVKLPAWVILDRRLTDGDRITLAYIVTRIFGESFALSQSEIMRHRGISVRATRNHIENLERTGYLVRRSGPRNVDVFSRGAAMTARPTIVDETGNQMPHRQQDASPATGCLSGNRIPEDRQQDAGACGNQMPGSSDYKQTKQTTYVADGSATESTRESGLIRADKPIGPKKATGPSPDVLETFEHWKLKLGKNAGTKLDPKRAKRIRWAIDAYGIEAAKRCIDGYSASAFHLGQNEQRTRYDDVSLFFRDAEHFERGVEFARGASTPTERFDWNAAIDAINEGRAS